MSQLTQDDFRKLLSTPSPASEVSSTPKPLKPTIKRDADGFAKPLPTKKHKPISKKPSPESDEVDEPSNIRYRDRARERREGKNKDYADSEAMLAILEASKSNEGSALHAASQTPVIDQTKYLGGDVNHTHLVRGLDKTLLERVKREIGQSEDEKTKEADAQKYVAALHGDGPVQFNSKFAESIYTCAINVSKEPLPLRNEFFLAGRMAFSWDLGLGAKGEYVGSSDIPTVVVRSKADVKDFDRKMQASSHEIVIDKIAQVMQMRCLSGGIVGPEKKKLKKKDKGKTEEHVPAPAPIIKQTAATTPSAPQSAQIADDDDIFVGAGRDYELQVDESRAWKAETALVNSKKLKLFDNDGDISMFDTLDQPALTGLDDVLKQSANVVDSMMGAGSASKIGLSTSNTEENEYIPNHKHSGIQLKKRVFGEDDDSRALQASKQKDRERSDMDLDLDSDSDEESASVKKSSMFDGASSSVRPPISSSMFAKKPTFGEKGEKNNEKEKKPNKKAKFNSEFDKLDKMMKNKYGQGLGK